MRLFLTALATLLAGCGAKPQILRHYAEDVPGGARSPTLELSVFLANPKGVDSGPLIAGLHERAQAELIKAVAAKLPPASTPKDLMTALEASPEPDDKPCAWADKTVVTKKLVVTLLGDLSKPADRVDKLEVKVAFPDGSARAKFTSWDRFDSVYASINIGSAKFTQTDKVTLGRTNTDTSNLPSSAGSVVKLLSVGAESTDALEESATYALRRLSVGGSLTDSAAKLVQEGGPNLNLFGTSSATITLKLVTGGDPRPVYKLSLKKDGKSAGPADVGVERCQAKFAASSKTPLQIDVSGTATLREARSGDATVMEGDDNANITSKALTAPRLDLIGEDDLHLQMFGLVRCDSGASLDACTRLKLDLPELGAGKAEELHFLSASAAGALREWLVEQTKTGDVKVLGGRQIGMLGKSIEGPLTGLNSATVSQLRVARLWQNR